jgi:hypothetical protein
MAHTPVNHPLRPVYRALGVLSGLYLVLFGVLGIVETGSAGLFAVGDGEALGQGTNLAWSIVSIVGGAIIALAGIAGRNIDVAVFAYAGWGMLGVGTFMLAAIRTDVNIFNFSIGTVIVTYTIGMLLITSGLYSKVVAPAEAGAPRQVRQSQA